MLIATISLRNEGPFPGHEVVQLYTESAVWRPKAELRAFTKVWLLAGETKQVELSVPRRDVCGYWDEETMCWRAERGTYAFVVDHCPM
jgi:beta-glucosidase